MMDGRTSFLAKLFGLYCILAALSLSLRGRAMVKVISNILHDPAMIFVLGAVTVLAGLATVLAHNVWTGGALRVMVTLVGWMTLMKGLLFWFLPADEEANFFLGVMRYEQLFYVYVAFALMLGLWFTYRGFAVKERVK
jgi:hypothetical protein